MESMKYFFSGLEDPRGENRRHLLGDIVFIACCAVICGAESWDDIELLTLRRTEKLW